MAAVPTSQEQKQQMEPALTEDFVKNKEELQALAEKTKQEEVTKKIIEKEKARQREQEKKAKDYEESKVNILILGSKHLASHIVHDLRERAKFTVVDISDPAAIFLNPMVNKEVRRSSVTLHHISTMDIENALPAILDMGNFDFIIDTICTHDAVYSQLNVNQTYQTNIMFTEQLLHTVIKHNRSRSKFLYISTDKVYGDQGVPAGYGPTDEKNPINDNRWWSNFKISELDRPNPIGIRSVSRYMQEALVTGTCKTYNMDYMVLRIGNVYGRYTPQKSMINSFIIDALTQSAINIYGDRFASRDFVPAEEVTNLIKSICITDYKQDHWNDTYNIGGMYPSRNYVQNMAEFMQTLICGASFLDPQYNYIKPYMSVRIKHNPPRCFEDTEEAKIRIWLDCTKAKDKLGYNPQMGKEWQHGIYEIMLWNAAYHCGYDMDEVNEMKMKVPRA